MATHTNSPLPSTPSMRGSRTRYPYASSAYIPGPQALHGLELRGRVLSGSVTCSVMTVAHFLFNVDDQRLAAPGNLLYSSYLPSPAGSPPVRVPKSEIGMILDPLDTSAYLISGCHSFLTNNQIWFRSIRNDV